ncbi:STAS domain-containing protein [Halopseudomonas salegens]|uniref:Anti-anti-sigma factor n=1 Tax=Halopseudomonas salegens TaxID=1434072 RepID=A0A1H2EBG4_9GAMM|nr:STAS domain-containing protein [Halopseudomonas salegens]SDT92373.1 anti-anti-sigma factor [Halopseudomonas salegens]
MSAELVQQSDLISLRGEIDFANARSLQEQLSAAVARAGNNVRVDLSGVDHANSVGLSLLLSTARNAEANGVTLGFSGLPQQLQSMAAVCGLEDWLVENAAAEPAGQQENV